MCSSPCVCCGNYTLSCRSLLVVGAKVIAACRMAQHIFMPTHFTKQKFGICALFFCGSHVLSLSSIVLFVIGFHLIISHSRPLPFMGAEFFIHTGVDPTIHQTYGLQTFKDCHPIVGLEVHVLQTAWSKNVPQKQIRVVRFRMFDDTALSLSSLLLVMAKVGNGPQKAPHHCSTGMPRCAQMDWICAMCKWVGHQLQHVQTSRCFAIIQFSVVERIKYIQIVSPTAWFAAGHRTI